MPLTAAQIEDIVVYQIGALAAMVTAEGATLQHVKPHGALYNVASVDRAIATAIARAIVTVNRHLILVGLAGSELIDAGREAGLRTASEVFADRGYDSGGKLLPRDREGAVIHDTTTVAERAVWMVRQRAVPGPDGTPTSVDVDTICLHGDTPVAPQLAQAVRQALESAGIAVSRLSSNSKRL
jgi:UPF0271 protein